MTLMSPRSPRNGEDRERQRQVNELAKAILEGRLTLVRGVTAIGLALGVSAFKAHQFLLQGIVEGAWRTPGGRWLAIRPRLKPEPAPLLDAIEAAVAADQELSG